MPRKCSTLFDGKSCDSGYKKSDFNGIIFGFPNPKTDVGKRELEKWIEALPNYIDITKITKYMGICEKHWKPGYESKSGKNGTKKPINPPTEFGTTPKSFTQQSHENNKARESEKRGVLAENRRETLAEKIRVVEKEKDEIKSWRSVIEYCSNLQSMHVISNDDYVRLSKLSDSFPPTILYSIQIDRLFNVTAYHGSTPVKLYDILVESFQHKLSLFSQIDRIVEKVQNSSLDFGLEVQAAGRNILSLCELTETTEEANKKIAFICNQLMVQSLPGQHQGKQYDAYLISEAANLYLRSRNAYRALRSILILPHEKTLRAFFGKFSSAGDASECIQAIFDVFSALDDDHQKFVFISADEIYVRPAIRFRAGRVIGFAQNHDTPTPAKTVLALMINFLLGTPAFVARLAPVTNLTHEFLVDLLFAVLRIIHEAGGYVFGVVTDNLSVNQKSFKAIREKCTPLTIYSTEHPIPNEKFSSFKTMYDTTHLMKSFRNNWLTEGTRTLVFIDPISGRKLTAKWSDLVYIYKVEEKNLVKKVPIDYQTLYPNNFEKQKVKLVMNVFNEKTVEALNHHGKNDTALLVSLFTRMWKILNVKNPTTAKRLNDPDREAFTDPSDPRLDFLLKMASSIKQMDSGKRGARIQGLTSDTANAFHQTLHAIVDIIKDLLDSGYKYVLPGKLQSDRLEGEFGIYRSSSGGNYFISVEQVVSSLSMQRLKLYHKLEIEQSIKIEDSPCCSTDLESNDDELELVENSFSNSSNLNEDERSTLYYISGYVAFKEGLGVDATKIMNSNDSEFLQNVSRGKLSHPSPELFDLSLYYYSFFKSRVKKCCDRIFLKGYQIIYESTDYEFSNISGINKRFSNSFFKAFVKQETDMQRKYMDQKRLKKRKLDN